MKRIAFLASGLFTGMTVSAAAGAIEPYCPFRPPLPVTHVVPVTPDSIMLVLVVIGAAVCAILVGAAMGLRQQATRSAQAEAERQTLLRWAGVLLPFAVLLLIEVVDASRSVYVAAREVEQSAMHHVRVVQAAWHPGPGRLRLPQERR